jgi:N-methylhydantoinase B/oxoprolinase/acetone carboxylase alpha subunit
VPLRPGDLVRIETPGAGGYGPPEARRREDVLWDLLEEKISAATAAAHGVVPEDGELTALARRRRHAASAHQPPRGIGS